MEPPTGLIPLFSKTKGNTYTTVLHHPFLFKEKPTQAQNIARRISGAVVGEVFAQVKPYQVPITNSSPSHLHYLPFASHFPLPHFTLAVLFALSFPISSSLSRLHSLVCLFACIDLMAAPKGPDHLLRRMDEIESNIRSFMNLQFEHNNFFRKELKEQKSFLGFMNKELDDMNKEFYGVNAQITRLEFEGPTRLGGAPTP